MTVTVSRVLEGAFSAAAGASGLTGFIMLFSALMHSGLIGIYTKFAFSGRGIGGIPGGAPELLVHVAPTFGRACVSVYQCRPEGRRYKPPDDTCDENRLIASKTTIT